MGQWWRYCPLRWQWYGAVVEVLSVKVAVVWGSGGGIVR